MRPNPIVPLIAILFACLAPSAGRAAVEAGAGPEQVVTIGALSYRGEEMARRTWGATLVHLRETLPGIRFRFHALTLNALTDAATRGTLDFVITNPGHSFQLVRRTGASRIASARSLATEDQTRALGSAIITRADGPIHTLEALRGESLAVVSDDAFGGYLVARHALREHLGEEPALDVRVVGFPHQAVVDAVLSGAASAGVVRACLIESLGATGRLDPAAIRVLGERDAPRFDCQASTPLYPGWAFLKLPHVPPEQATEVTRALLAMPRQSGNDPWLGHDGWIAPVSYAAVEEVYRSLGLYPYGEDLAAVLRRWVRDNLAWVAVGAVLLGMFLLHVGYVEILVRRRTRQLQAASQRSRELEGELAHAERVTSMNVLAGSLAHDLNQPLAAISTFAHGLLLRHQRGTADAHAVETTLKRISEQAGRASAFIRSMRAFLTKQPERREELDLRDLLDEVVMLTATHAGKHACTLEWHRPATPVAAHADGVQLRQVAVALVQNAIDASPDGGPVEINLVQDGDGAVLTVSDRGTGLSDEARARALEPFFSTKGGLGLGLATAAAIVDHHDGRLELTPRTGGGTVARVVLPVAPEDTGDTP